MPVLTPDPVVLLLTVALSAPVLVSVGPGAPSPPRPPMQAACPAGMVKVEGFCMDRYEAPNRKGALPLVMYTFTQAEAWCQARGKRLCYDDEWTRACQGPDKRAWPYGNAHKPGVCNDDQPWRQYDRLSLRLWPHEASDPYAEGMGELYAAAESLSPDGAEAASHLRWLYQATPSGAKEGCVSAEGVFDLTGNIEEWTRRREANDNPRFSNRLKGRYWSEGRECERDVSNHSDKFRYYEIGFRCCKDL